MALQCRPLVTGVTVFAQHLRVGLNVQLYKEERAAVHILIPHVKITAVWIGISQFCMVTYRNFIVPMDLEFFMPPEKIPQALKALDVDGDGKISLADMRDAVIQVWPRLPANLSCPACLPFPAIFVLLCVSCCACSAMVVLSCSPCHVHPVMFTLSCLFCLPHGLHYTNKDFHKAVAI